MNKKLTLGLVLLLVIAFSACTTHKKNKKTKDAELLLGFFYLSPYPYVMITPEPGTITINNATNVQNRSYVPSCTGVSGNDQFRFYIKYGSTNKLLINFMGGGACWNGANCFGTNTTTYFNQLDAVPQQFLNVAFQGVMNSANGQNPFETWNMVFIPYCSGDLHFGSGQYTYTDPTNNTQTTLKHHGFDNVLSVIDYMKKNYNPEQVFVVGQSAGGYGAILNFAYIRETFPSVRMDVLSDASNGVTPPASTDSSLIPNGWNAKFMPNWGVSNNIPSWVDSTLSYTNLTNGTLQMDNIFIKLANHYSSSNVAQYMAEYDGNQRFFYGVQRTVDSVISGSTTYTDAATQDSRSGKGTYSTLFGSSDAYYLPDSESCYWNQTMATYVTTTAGSASNYRYYRAPGDVHTITTSEDMYNVTSNGVKFIDWMNGMIGSGSSNWTNVTCSNCQAPKTSTSSSLNCSTTTASP